MGKRRKFLALEEEKKQALFELWVALVFLLSFVALDIAIYLLYPFYALITAFYGPLLTSTLINLSFLLLTLLLGLLYRRWKTAERIASELEGVIASIASHVLLVVSPEGVIERCSRSIDPVLRYTVEEVTNQKTDFLYEEASMKTNPSSAAYEALERRGFQVTEALGKQKGGAMIPLEVITGKLANRPGRVVLLRDVSERKHLEEELVQHHKLEALGRLAGGIAHDYNNLMTVISGFAKLMRRRVGPGDPLRKELDELLKAADRATALTKQLLTFGRRQLVHPKRVNLNRVILNLDKLLRQVIREDIQLVMNLDRNLRPLEADVTQLEQVILNLVTNARNAMPQGGKIVIETHNLDKILLDYRQESLPSSMESGDYVLLSVQDTGAGMTEEVKKHLFEPFFTTGEKKSGVGLGLATCYGIVRQNRGRIFVSSEVGRGTTVRVYFPCAEGKPEEAVERAEPEALPQGSETILLAEDDASVRAFTSRVLRDQGYEVMEAANGFEALELVERNPKKRIQLLLTDLVMPRMRGEELARRLKHLKPHLKVLFTSGYTEEVNGEEKKENAEEFLPKPFSPYSLAAKVREVLGHGVKSSFDT